MTNCELSISLKYVLFICPKWLPSDSKESRAATGISKNMQKQTFCLKKGQQHNPSYPAVDMHKLFLKVLKFSKFHYS